MQKYAISLNVLFGSGSVNVLQSANVNHEEASSDAHNLSLLPTDTFIVYSLNSSPQNLATHSYDYNWSVQKHVVTLKGHFYSLYTFASSTPTLHKIQVKVMSVIINLTCKYYHEESFTKLLYIQNMHT